MHTTCPVTMSGSEIEEFTRVKTNKKLTMPGRLGVKESLHGIYMHTAGLVGLQASEWFCLTSSTGVVCVILVDCVRMDLSHQSVFLDAALLARQHETGSTYLTHFLATLIDEVVLIDINEDEAKFWKHLLPTCAERCRQWKHKKTCEYQVSGSIPICTEGDEPFICSCGIGEFPENYLEHAKDFKEVAKLAVRVAIPVIFASPISKDDVSPAGVKAALRSLTRAQADDKPKKDGCLKCGVATTKAGNALLKCVKCKTAQYCSPNCQKKDWKKHKLVCKQVREQSVGDDAA